MNSRQKNRPTYVTVTSEPAERYRNHWTGEVSLDPIRWTSNC
jgi:hypothetical protein